MTKRNYGLDLLKVYACFCVVALHAFGSGNLILEHSNGFTRGITLSNLFYYGSTCAIPVFFMVNGFLILRKNNLNYEYIFKKIMSIVLIVFFWTGLYSIPDLVLKSTKFSFLYNFFGSFIQKGPFFHFWFFGALCMVLLCAPLLSYLLNKKTKLFISLLIIFIIITISISIYSEIFHYPIQKNINQSFRLWTWYTYYLFGGLIAKYEIKINKYIVNKQLRAKILLTVFIFGIAMIAGSLVNVHVIKNAYAEYNYDNIIVMILSVALFIYFVCAVGYSNRQILILKYISPVIMGIYIMHPFVIEVLKMVIQPMNDLNNIVIYILTLLITILVSRVIIKIPYFKKMIAL